jgi:hypothetical protein
VSCENPYCPNKHCPECGWHYTERIPSSVDELCAHCAAECETKEPETNDG